MGPRPIASLLAVAAAFALGGCSHAQATRRDAARADARELLDAGVLPGMTVATRALDRSQVAMQTPIPGLSDRLHAWGFTGAAEREFTGGRRAELERVVSRTVTFHELAGATAYARALVRGAANYLGAGARTSALRPARGDGWIIRPAACGCHPGPPTLIAVLPRSKLTAWLSLTGDDATPDRVRALALALPR